MIVRTYAGLARHGSLSVLIRLSIMLRVCVCSQATANSLPIKRSLRPWSKIKRPARFKRHQNNGDEESSSDDSDDEQYTSTGDEHTHVRALSCMRCFNVRQVCSACNRKPLNLALDYVPNQYKYIIMVHGLTGRRCFYKV